ncbi:MAG: hypothetical protein AAFO63_06325, partial [Pseudomonadota bacterium]
AEDVPQTAAARAAATSIEAAPQSLPQILPGLGQVCFTEEMAQTLTADQQAVAEREAKLVERELALTEWEGELEDRTDELINLQSTLDTRWRTMTAEADGDIDHLASMYGTMKSKDAAPIFNQMDPKFAAGFLRLMDSEQAGAILADMDSDKAYITSVTLANLNGDVRRAANAADTSAAQ